MRSGSASSRGRWGRCLALSRADGRLLRDAQRGAQSRDVLRPEDDAIAGGDIDEIEVDPGPGDLASQVRKDAGTVLDIHDHDFALVRDRNVGDRQRVLHGLAMRHEDVELGPVARSYAGGGRDVDAGVADRVRNARECARGVLDVDDQVDRHVSGRLSLRRREARRVAGPLWKSPAKLRALACYWRE